jgi:cobalamin biosynthesis Mg chelatase CobN
MRLASLAICLIAVVWFATFALDRTSEASSHQQAEVSASGPSGATTTTSSSGSKGESTSHEAVDKAFSTLASPFSRVTAGSSSQWTIHIVDTLLVLIVYGFGLGFLARLLRVGL